MALFAAAGNGRPEVAMNDVIAEASCSNGTVTLTSSAVRINHKGLAVARAFQRDGEFPLARIEAVRLRPASIWNVGEIQFSIGDGKAVPTFPR